MPNIFCDVYCKQWVTGRISVSLYARLFVFNEIRGQLTIYTCTNLQVQLIMIPAGTGNDQRGPRVYTEGDGGAAKHRERDRASTRDNDVYNVSSTMMCTMRSVDKLNVVFYISYIIWHCREYSVTECHQSYKK